jgi:hypothetical protein
VAGFRPNRIHGAREVVESDEVRAAGVLDEAEAKIRCATHPRRVHVGRPCAGEKQSRDVLDDGRGGSPDTRVIGQRDDGTAIALAGDAGDRDFFEGRHRDRRRALRAALLGPGVLSLMIVGAVRFTAQTPVAHATSNIATGRKSAEPTLAAVLERAGVYVASFHRRLSGIVAEERYVQDARTPVWRSRTPRMEHRELRSDLLLANVGGTSRWLEFRDVFEVDGEAVRDRTDRLTNLFLHPSPVFDEQVAAILAESARYNVGGIERTVNTPIFPLAFLAAEYQSHFRFFRANDHRPPMASLEPPPGSAIAPPFRPQPEAWVIRFEEVGRPTIIRTLDGSGDVPSHGRFWVEPETGRVLMSEVVAEDRNVRGTLAVSYQSEPLVGMLVPVAMRERYEGRRTKALVDASAVYGKFRHFQVNVDEKFLLKK